MVVDVTGGKINQTLDGGVSSGKNVSFQKKKKKKKTSQGKRKPILPVVCLMTQPFSRSEMELIKFRYKLHCLSAENRVLLIS